MSLRGSFPATENIYNAPISGLFCEWINVVFSLFDVYLALGRPGISYVLNKNCTTMNCLTV